MSVGGRMIRSRSLALMHFKGPHKEGFDAICAPGNPSPGSRPQLLSGYLLKSFTSLGSIWERSNFYTCLAEIIGKSAWPVR